VQAAAVALSLLVAAGALADTHYVSSSGAVIDGLTITHGASGAGGGGILCSAGTIRNCVIVDNSAVGSSGGGIQDCIVVKETVKQ